MHNRKKSGIAPGVRRLASKGWSTRAIAGAYGITAADVRAILRPPAPRVHRPPRPVRLRDSWRLGDWRFRDDVGAEDPAEAPPPPLATPPGARPGPELVPQAERPELPPVPAAAVPPPWGSPYASGPRKITAAVLAAALQLRAEGWTWPAIARRFQCHRMELYHALRRQPASGAGRE